MSARTAIPHWLAHHGTEKSAIETYAVMPGRLETIAEIYGAAEADHMATADFIVNAVNNYEKHCLLIADLAATLERCFEGNGAAWPTTAGEARAACARAKKALAIWVRSSARRSRN